MLIQILKCTFRQVFEHTANTSQGVIEFLNEQILWSLYNFIRYLLIHIISGTVKYSVGI